MNDISSISTKTRRGLALFLTIAAPGGTELPALEVQDHSHRPQAREHPCLRRSRLRAQVGRRRHGTPQERHKTRILCR